jgi:hypothetical protein
MTQRVTVFVNDRPVLIHRGLSVEHALIAFDSALHRAALQGEVEITDEHGFRVGLKGALQAGSRLLVKPKPETTGG